MKSSEMVLVVFFVVAGAVLLAATDFLLPVVIGFFSMGIVIAMSIADRVSRDASRKF
ncbi:MAG: hypothetical protein BWY04_00741 [candidate division CPR1 bacterium ADurb.Bin160]|uniref:Uncharacterized protein n=1 Tax=candidate division CPR1 bacterium ADurb.Bin160 TaxID=1852826 RepID=A0A1V5ZN72_9BACT|nr:MAG: hypothetical protein BWY04_00741 [candidate division CPR1 bacterium ADurb.Bin160]